MHAGPRPYIPFMIQRQRNLWFDRGLISLDEDLTILIAKDRLPDTITRLVRQGGRLLPPTQENQRPHMQFLRYHRDYIYKG
jgi:putative restriction endonuclease